jgi:hypothetical protein
VEEVDEDGGSLVGGSYSGETVGRAEEVVIQVL